MSTNIKLPKDWKWIKLNDVADITSSKRIFQEEYVPSGIPFYRTKEIKELSEGKELTFDLFISNEKYNEIKSRFAIPKKGDILLSAVGTIGISYIIKDNKPFYFKDGNLMWLRDLKNIDANYLSYGLTNFIKNKKGAKTSGSAYSALTIETIKNFDFPLPPLSTQQAIVSKIEELFSELDNGIANLKNAQQQLKTYRQSVLKWAFEGRFTSPSPRGEGWGEVKDGELPKGWIKLPINQIAEINPKLPNKENISRQLEVQFLPMKLVEEIINKIHLTEIRKFEEVLKGSYTPFINGDVIFAKVTPCMENGKIAKVENLKNGIGFGSSEFHVIRASEKILGSYIFNFLVQDHFRNEAANAMTGAVGLRRVPKQFIENYLIPLPPIEEQEKIILEIESRLSVADKLEESITQSLQQAEALRQSILKKAFEGKLV